MTTCDKLSIIIPNNTLYYKENFKALAMYVNDISCIVVKNNKDELHLNRSHVEFSVNEIEINTKIEINTYVMSHVLDHVETSTVLFLNKDTQLNYSQFDKFLYASKSLTQGFLTGVSLRREGEHWKPQTPYISAAHEEWGDFWKFASNISVGGGVIFHTDSLRNFLQEHSAGNIFNNILLLLHMYVQNSGSLCPNVISMQDKKSNFHELQPCEITTLLHDLESFLNFLKYHEKICFEFLAFIMTLLWEKVKTQNGWKARLTSFLLIREFVKNHWPLPIKTINFFGEELPIDMFLSLDAIVLLQLAKVI